MIFSLLIINILFIFDGALWVNDGSFSAFIFSLLMIIFIIFALIIRNNWYLLSKHLKLVFHAYSYFYSFDNDLSRINRTFYSEEIDIDKGGPLKLATTSGWTQLEKDIENENIRIRRNLIYFDEDKKEPNNLKLIEDVLSDQRGFSVTLKNLIPGSDKSLRFYFYVYPFSKYSPKKGLINYDFNELYYHIWIYLQNKARENIKDISSIFKVLNDISEEFDKRIYKKEVQFKISIEILFFLLKKEEINNSISDNLLIYERIIRGYEEYKNQEILNIMSYIRSNYLQKIDTLINSLYELSKICKKHKKYILALTDVERHYNNFLSEYLMKK